MDTTVYLIRHSMKMERTKNHWPGYDRIQPLSVEGERRAQALADVEENLGASTFFRCSKCSLVNLEYVESVAGSDAMVAGVPVQVSRARKKALLDALNDYINEVSK